MLAYLAPRANWPAILLLVAACSYDASGLVSAGPTTSTTSTSSSTGDSSSTTAPTTTPPTSTDGTASDSGTTSPVDPTTSTGTSTGTTGPDLTTGTTDPGTDTGTTSSTTDPGTGTTTGSTTEPDTTSTTGTTGTTDSTSTGDSSSTGGDVCEDTGMEPNETEATAVDLGDQGCKADPKNFAGVLNGAADVDWFTYHGLSNGMDCGMPDPVVNSVLTASDTVRMCVFADCDESNAEFTCPNGTMSAMSPGGHPGCCGSASMMFTVNCNMNNNESAQVYIRLDQAPADACVDYDVDYSYHN